MVLCEPQLLRRLVVLHVDSVASREAEGLLDRIEFGFGVGPGVAIVGNHVAAMAHVTIVEEEIHLLDGIAQRNPYAYPPDQFDDLDAPSNFVRVSYIVKKIP